MTTLTDDQRKHLDYIQAVISRMSTDSFLIKGWSLTIGTAIYGFAAEDSSWRLAAIGLLPALVFWGLDAYYLWHERLFRKLYVDAAAGRTSTYMMDIKSYKATTTWRGTLMSRTIWPVYVVLLLVGGLLIADATTRDAPMTDQPPSKAALMAIRTSS